MDPEQTFLWVHAHLSRMLSQLLTLCIRLVLKYLYLTVAVALFCLLVVMHNNFVQQVWIPCLVLFYCPRLLSLLLLLLWFCDCLGG
jgi:membrane glycosyltransferase